MFYEDRIDEKETILAAKQCLEFLGNHLHSFSYQEYIEKAHPMIVQEEDIMEYMQYSRSVIKMSEGTTTTNQVLKAMQIKEFERKKRQDREQQLQWICYGLQRLKEKERRYLIARYIYHLSNKAILEKYGIVESTLNRNIRKGCLNLAFFLKIEILKETL